MRSSRLHLSAFLGGLSATRELVHGRMYGPPSDCKEKLRERRQVCANGMKTNSPICSFVRGAPAELASMVSKRFGTCSLREINAGYGFDSRRLHHNPFTITSLCDSL